MILDVHSELFSWIRGGLLTLSIFHLLIYLQNHRKSYLYYSLFLLGLFFYFVIDILDPIVKNKVSLYTNFSLQFLSYAAFTTFARHLLETKNKLFVWDKILKHQTIIHLLFAVLFVIIQFLFGYDLQVKLFIIVGVIISIVTTVEMFFIYQISGRTSKYFAFGSIIFTVFALISFLSLLIGEDIYNKYGMHSITFFYLGAAFQSVVYASTLGYSIKIITQESENNQIKLAYRQKELEELKMTALQSQMNPHFLFNSLNSINNFILKSDIEKASDYITKFSKLIRVILKSSSSLTISFSEELEILALYAKLEQMRINGGFEYIVNIDKKINLEQTKVPPLFLQPFIENAIWHGLTYIEGDKKIVLQLKKHENNIICEIIDNGRGINKSKEESHKKINRRKFFGIKATEDRIRLLYKSKDVNVTITDISNENTTGTKVTITLPCVTNL